MAMQVLLPLLLSPKVDLPKIPTRSNLLIQFLQDTHPIHPVLGHGVRRLKDHVLVVTYCAESAARASGKLKARALQALPSYFPR